MAQQNPNSGNNPTTDEFLEFRSSDDAWYSVSVVLSGEVLTVKYCNLSDVFDERYNANDFKTEKEVDDFRVRFRPASMQLQDSECRKAIEGVLVCASHEFREEDVRFYDAFIEEVEHRQHSFTNGEEECLCKFMLFWQHGPNAGNLTVTTVEHICLIQPCLQIDPQVASFLKMSREKLIYSSSIAGLISNDNASKDGTTNTNHKEICSSYVWQKSRPQETSCTRGFESTLQVTEGRIIHHRERDEEDIDLGGEAFFPKKFKESGNKHSVLLENLEIHLSPATIVEFIHKQTKILAEACVFPSFSYEIYTRGIITVDCEEKLLKLYGFLDNPDHMIVSSRGRPWVISAKTPGPSRFEVSMGTVMPVAPKKTLIGNNGISDDLRVVHSGTKEYVTAKKLKDLSKDFSYHLQLLHKRLASEERKISQLSRAV